MTTHVIAPIDLPAFLAPTIAAALDEAESQAGFGMEPGMPLF